MTRPLATWEDTPTKQAILDLVATVTDPGSEGFVPPAERIATFDNDGTLWCEKPMVQEEFILKRLAEMARSEPSHRKTRQWKAIWDGVREAFDDITVEDFEARAAEFFDTALHPVYKQPYQNLTYVPMLQLLDFLVANGFTCYMVTGSGRDFMRSVSQSIYKLPPERIIGSSFRLAFKNDDHGANITHAASLGIVDNRDAKATQIWERVGRRPILAAGNTNGDIEMLQFAADQPNPTLCLLVHHDDAKREVKYHSGAGKAIKTADSDDWTVVSMKNDWKQVFSFQ